MDLYEVLEQVLSLLQKNGRVSSRALKDQFQLDDKTWQSSKRSCSTHILRLLMMLAGD